MMEETGRLAEVSSEVSQQRAVRLFRSRKHRVPNFADLGTL